MQDASTEGHIVSMRALPLFQGLDIVPFVWLDVRVVKEEGAKLPVPASSAVPAGKQTSA